MFSIKRFIVPCFSLCSPFKLSLRLSLSINNYSNVLLFSLCSKFKFPFVFISICTPFQIIFLLTTFNDINYISFSFLSKQQFFFSLFSCFSLLRRIFFFYLTLISIQTLFPFFSLPMKLYSLHKSFKPSHCLSSQP